jgi:hypothetical protein
LLWVVFEPLVILRLDLRIVRLAKWIHVELKRVMSLTDSTRHTRHTHSLHLGNHTLCRIYVVQTIILTRNVIVGVVRVIFIVVGRGR